MPRKARHDLVTREVLTRIRLCRNHPHDRGLPSAVRGDVRVPGLPGGDDGLQLTQDRRCDDGLGLGGLEPVDLAAVQVSVAGGVNPAVLQASPNRAPGGHPQPPAAGAAGLSRRSCRRFVPAGRDRRA